jgi:hypothetical protein
MNDNERRRSKSALAEAEEGSENQPVRVYTFLGVTPFPTHTMGTLKIGFGRQTLPRPEAYIPDRSFLRIHGAGI